MKCVIDATNKVSRVTDVEADKMVNSGEYKYVAKKYWKEQIRPKKPVQTKPETKVKAQSWPEHSVQVASKPKK